MFKANVLIFHKAEYRDVRSLLTTFLSLLIQQKANRIVYIDGN
jgi:hypothetical protein